jgi:FkbH-like protein
MNTLEIKSLIIADFTADVLAGYLNNDDESPRVKAACGPYGQVFQVLADETHGCWRNEHEFAVIWTRPEAVIKSFKPLLNYQSIPPEKIMSDVDQYCDALLRVRDRVRFAFVPTWVLPLYHRGYGILDMKRDLGVASTLMKMNLRLAENLEAAPNIYVLNAQRWIEAAGKKAFIPDLWYMAKAAFGNEVFKEASKDIRAALRGLSGSSRKLIIVDLDDTLWGGTVGEEGWQNLTLGGHDPAGEAFAEFQEALKSLTNRGVLLGVVSKNDESIALDAIKSNPEMVLKLEDFAGWKINWGDKARNIVELVSELNLGLQSTVFIDNDPIERARVREALPEVLVPDWPTKPSLYKSALLGSPYFDNPSISQEDRERTQMYVSERERQNARSNLGSLEDWLETLETKVEVQDLNEENLPRAAQLLNKTSQLNLRTRRMTEGELRNWIAAPNRKFWVSRISDRFGDSGLTALVSIEIFDRKANIIDFVLSCRVMGRKIEETMIHIAASYAKAIGLEELFAEYIPTAKNKPCLEFWGTSGFELAKEHNAFKWNLRQAFPCPSCVELRFYSKGSFVETAPVLSSASYL